MIGELVLGVSLVGFVGLMFGMYRIDARRIERYEAGFRAKFPDCCAPNGQSALHHLHSRVVSVPARDCLADPPLMSSVSLTWCCRCSYKLSQRPDLYPTERINA